MINFMSSVLIFILAFICYLIIGVLITIIFVDSLQKDCENCFKFHVDRSEIYGIVFKSKHGKIMVLSWPIQIINLYKFKKELKKYGMNITDYIVQTYYSTI